MPQNGGIQLFPESRKEIEVRIPGENRLLYLGLAVIGLVLILYFGLRIYSSPFKGKIDALDSELKTLEGKRDKDAEGKIILIKDQFTKVSQIVDNHVIWSHLLRKVQLKTSPQVQFKTMKLSFEDKKIDIEAEAGSYTVVARQIASYLSEEIITDIKLNEARLLPNGRLKVNMILIFDQSSILLESISRN